MPRNANKDKLSNYSIDFDGSSNYITISDPSELTGDFTIIAWIFPNRVSDSYEMIYTQGTATGGGSVPPYFAVRDTRLHVYINTTYETGLGFITADEWQQVAVTRTSGVLNLYRNGVEYSGGGSIQNGTINTSSAGVIGKWYNSSHEFKGQIAELCIFDYAISEAQRNYLYNLNNPMAITGGEPITYYPLGDNSNPNAPGSFPNISVGADSVFDFTPNDYINIGSQDELKNITELSISLWFNYDSIATSADGLVGRDSSTRVDGNWYVALQSNQIRFLLKTANGQDALNSSTISPNKWYHTLCVWNGTTMKIYLNGDLSNSITLSNATGTLGSASDIVTIGRRLNLGSSSGFLNGEVSNVQLWNSDLSSSAETLYNNGQPLMTGTQPQAANLKAWYKLNQSANWEADTAGNWQIPDAVSSYPQSFNFDGSGEHIDVSSFDNALLSDGDISFALWCKLTTTGTYQYILSSEHTSTISGINIAMHPNTNLSFSRAQDIANTQNGTGYSIPGFSYGSWHHLCGTYNATSGELKAYVDGDLKSTTNDSADARSASTALKIGGLSTYATLYAAKGQISNVQIWNTTLSAPQIETLYNNGVPLTTAIATNNLKAWYKLNNNEKFDGTNWSVENQAYPAGFDSALDFDRTQNDNVFIGSPSAIQNLTNITLSVWVKVPNTFSLPYYTVASKGEYYPGNNGSQWYLTINTGHGGPGGSFVIYKTSDARNATGVNYTTNIDDNKWHNIVCINDGTDLKVYIDGQLDGTNAGNGGNIYNGNRDLIIGKLGGNTRNFDGLMSNMVIWGDSQETEINNIYNNGTPATSYTNTPVAWWKLNNTTTGIQDSVGSSDGTNNGTTKVNTFVSTEAATSSGMTEQNLVNNNVSALNGESSGMNTTNLVQSNLTRKLPFSNYSIQFDAAGGDYARTAAGSNSILSGSTSFTISAWVNFADLSALRPIVTNWEAGSTSYNYIFRYHNSQLQLYVRANGSTGNAFYGFTPTLNTWYNVVGTWNGTSGTIQLYLNGDAVGTPGSRTGTMPNITVSDNIGLYTSSINYFMDGKFSNIAYWKNSILSEDDILNIYNNGITQDLNNFRITPTNWFPLNESYTYFNGTSLIFRDAIAGRDATGFNIVQENIVGNAPGSEASGTGNNLTIADLKGNMYNSDKNAYSINMGDYADGVTNPANSGRSTDTP